MSAEGLSGAAAKEPATPPWIDAQLVAKALRPLADTREEAEAEVRDVRVTRGSAEGDNYATVVWRATAALQLGAAAPAVTRTVLFKAPHSGGPLSEFAKELGFFDREGVVLQEVIPRLQAMLASSAGEGAGEGDGEGEGDGAALAARCPLRGSAPVDHLALEDLSPQGFRVADRRRGLGLRHALLALRALARFHAASHALLAADGAAAWAQRLSNPWRRDNAGLRTYAENSLRDAAEAFRRWPGFEQYGDMLDKFKGEAMEKYAAFNDPAPGGFNVIAHGDFWLCNMMFRYDERGYPCDHRMLDFQMAHVASPAVDLLYFLSGSVSDDVHEHHEALLLREYHAALARAARRLGCQAPSLAELQADVGARGAMALFFAVGGVPVLKSGRVVDAEGAFEGDAAVTAAFDEMYDLPAVRRWLQRVVPLYAQRGWLPG